MDPVKDAQSASRPSSAAPAGANNRPASIAPADGQRNGRQFAEINSTLTGAGPQGSSIKGRGSRINGHAPSHDALPPQHAMAPPQPSARGSELGRANSVRGSRGPEPPQSNLSRSTSRVGFDYPETGPRPREAPATDYPRGAGYDTGRHASEYVDPRARSARDDYHSYPSQDTRGQYRDDYPRAPPQGRPTSQYGDQRPYAADPYTNRAPMTGGQGSEFARGDPRPSYGPPRAEYRDDRGPGRHDDRKRRAEDMMGDPAKRRRDGQ